MRTRILALRKRRISTILVWVVLAAATASAQSVASTPARGASLESDALKSLERQVEAAFQRADTPFLQSTLRDDFRFSHATGTVAGKGETLASFAKPGNFLSRTLTSVEAEVHGDVALTIGRIEVRSAAPREYTVCYVRLYERGGGQWQLVSHRTFREQGGFTETCAPR